MGIHIMPPLYEVVIKEQLFEKHDSPLTDIYAMSSGQYLAQSFTPQTDYMVTQLKLPFYRNIDPPTGTYTIEIRTNNVDEPSETVLWSETRSISDLPTTSYAWRTFTITNVSAQTNVPLWIVQTATWTPPVGINLIWQGDTPPPYPRGMGLARAGGPSTAWVGKTGYHDYGFRTFGRRGS